MKKREAYDVMDLKALRCFSAMASTAASRRPAQNWELPRWPFRSGSRRWSTILA